MHKIADENVSVLIQIDTLPALCTVTVSSITQMVSSQHYYQRQPLAVDALPLFHALCYTFARQSQIGEMMIFVEFRTHCVIPHCSGWFFGTACYHSLPA